MEKKTYTFISIFNFKDPASKHLFLDFANSKNGLEITRNYQGCLSLDLYNSKNDVNKIIMIQKWDNMKNKKSYLEMRQKEGTHDYFASLVNKPIELELLTPINFDSKL